MCPLIFVLISCGGDCTKKCDNDKYKRYSIIIDDSVSSNLSSYKYLIILKDLNKISQAFSHHLTGIFHSRITYPEKDAQDINNQSPEKNPS